MVPFNFIDTAVKGYRFLMIEHELVGRMAIIPLAIKMISAILLTMSGMDDAYLRQGLFLLPSYFAEGWLAAQVVRLAILGERWPQAGAAGNAARTRGILAGTVIYTLTMLVLSLFNALLMAAATPPTPEQAAALAVEPLQPTVSVFMGLLMILTVMLWCFRLLWLYIPAALDYPALDYLRRCKGYMASVHMAGLWLLCFVPLATLLRMTSEMLFSVFPPVGEQVASMPHRYGLDVFGSLLEIVLVVVTTAAMAYAVQSYYQKKPD